MLSSCTGGYASSQCVCVCVPSGKASRTEKYLGACAAGKWVLHKSFLEACRAENKFVEVQITLPSPAS